MMKKEKNEVSTEVINNLVLEKTLSNGIVRYAPAIGGGAALLSFFVFSTLTSILLAAGTVLLVAGVAANNYFLKADEYRQEYLENLHQDNIARHKRKMDALFEEIKKCLAFTNNDKFVKKVANQFSDIHSKIKSFNELLPKKFKPEELTFSRFQETAQQVYLSVIDNIESSVHSIQALKEVDIDSLEKRYIDLKKVISSKNFEKFDEEELKAVQERIDLRETKLNEIDEILAKNERALTELDNLYFKLSSARTYEGRAKQDIDRTLEELINLIESVDKYTVG